MDLVKIILLAIVYVAAAKFGLAFEALHGFASLVWPPTGIALAALLLFGTRLWPGIALGAFLANYWTKSEFLVATGIALGNTLEALVGVFFFRRFAGDESDLSRLKHVFPYVVLVAGFSTVMSATIGVASLFLAGIVPRADLTHTWSAWWVGDVISNLIIAPPILVWRRGIHFKFTVASVLEGFALGLAVISICFLIFGPWVNAGTHPFIYPYILFPFLIWTTTRYGPPANTGFALIVATVAIWGTVQGYGPFQNGVLADSLLSLQVFILSVSVTGLFFGALSREKESALQVRSDFLSIASHELKTPLSALRIQIQFAKRVLDQKIELSPEKFRSLIDSADRQLDHVIQLVEVLLDTSRIETEQLHLVREQVDLGVLVAGVVERLSEQLKQAKCSIEVQTKSKVVGNWDRSRIEQVVVNLLTNAIKYGGGHPIQVDLDKNEELARLTVRDHGEGIAQEHQARIFQRFKRVSSDRKIAGLGLGLYITREIVKAHGGQISVSSELRKGTTFSVELPLLG